MAKRQILKTNTLFPLESPACPVIKKERLKLSKAQSEFNRLNKKIAILRSDIHELPEREKRISAFYNEYARPLFDKESELKYHYLQYLDKMYETSKFTDKDRKTLEELIVNECEGVENFRIPEEKQAEMLAIRYKYTEIITGLNREEQKKVAMEDTLSMLSILGIKPNAKMKKAKDETELFNAVQDYLRSKFEKEVQEEEKKQTHKGQQKQIEEPHRKLTKKEMQQKFQEEQTLKSIREIYIELVKELHPDKETDETIRAIKEDRMKCLTDAYQKKDLSSLLSMQIDWLEETAQHPETKSDEVLKRYNKVLKSQLERLEEEFFLLCEAPFPAVEEPYSQYRRMPLNKLNMELEYVYSNHKGDIVAIEEYITSVSTLANLKKFLKKYAKNLKQNLQEEEMLNQFFNIFE
jgi:hypothetical protein